MGQKVHVFTELLEAVGSMGKEVNVPSLKMVICCSSVNVTKTTNDLGKL